MTTALPSLIRTSVFANNPSSYPGSHLAVTGIWPSSATDEGDGGPMLSGGGSSLGPTSHSAPQFMIPATPSSTSRGTGQPGLLQPPTQQQQQQQLLPQCAQALQQQPPNAPESIHRFARERIQAGGGSGGNGGGNGAARGPPALAVMASGAPYVSYLPAASSAALGSPAVYARCLTPEQPRRSHFTSERSERSETVSGWPVGGGSGGSTALTILPQAPRPLSGSAAWGGGGGGGGGSGGGDSAGQPGSPTPARMITHDVFILNRPITSASNAGERRRLFTGTSQELLRGAMLTNAPSMPLLSPVAAACGPAGGGNGGENRISRGRARGLSGGSHSLSLSLPLAAVDAAPAAGYQADAGPYSALPLSACSHRSPSPRIIRVHPGGLGSAAMSIIASGHHISRQQVVAQARGVERLLALDVEDALARAPTPRQVATLTPGTLDGMGHPVLLAADGARILKRIPDHLPRHAAERMVATPMKPEQLSLALESALDPDLDLDILGHDGGDGSSSYDEADYLPSSRGTGAGGGGSRIGGGGLSGILPYMSLGVESSVNGSMGLTGGGGGRPGARAGGGGGGRKGGATIAGGAGGGDGGSPQRMARSWSSPSRQPRGGGGPPQSRTETLDGSGGSILAAESSRASRIGVESRGGMMGNKQRRRSRSPVISREGLAAGGRVSPGKASPPGRGSGGANGGRRQSLAGEDNGPPKWLGAYIPKEDPLGLWTGKRMSKTEVIVEKRLFAMRHNPGMRLELESRAAEALRQRAAAQAEMAAVTRAREEEASARKAQLRAEIEARRYGCTSPREMDRGRSRTPRGFTKEARAALERRLLAEAEAEPRGPLSREEAATIIQSTWRMHCQRRRFLYIRSMVIRIQRAARLRYCVIRNRRRHAAAATLLLEFLCGIGGNRHATAAMDLREIHSNYIRRRLLEKKGDLRHQTIVAVLVREWESVEARILGLRSRSLKGSALAALAVSGFTASIAGGGGGSGGGGGVGSHHPGAHLRAVGGSAAAASTGSGGGSPDKDMLTAVAGEAHSAAHGTRLLGKALEARKKGVMLLGGGKDLNKQLTVEYAVAHAMATDRVTLTSREPVPSEVKALVSSCYLEHKSMAYTTFIGVVWRRRARWFGVFNQQRHMAMARSVVETGSAWRAMDTLAKEATEKLVGLLPVLPRMRTSATLRELRALMQAGVQEADLYTSYMLKGGIHELERRLHSEMLLRNSFGQMVRGGGHRESRDTLTPPNAPFGPATAAAAIPPSSPLVDGGGAGGGDGGGNRRFALNLGSLLPASTPPGQRRVSVTGSLACGGPVGQSPLAPQSSTTSLSQLESPRRASRTVRIDAAGASCQTGGGLGGGGGGGGGLAPLASPDAFLDTVSEAGSEMTSASNVSAMGGAGSGATGGGGGYAAVGLARARFFSMLPAQKAGVAQLKERWWRDAVVRVDACLRKRYKLNGVSLVASLEDPTAPNLELFSTKLAEINANPEKAESLLAALPGGAAAGTAGAVGAAHGFVGATAGGGGGGGGNNHSKPRISQEGTWSHRVT